MYCPALSPTTTVKSVTANMTSPAGTYDRPINVTAGPHIPVNQEIQNKFYICTKKYIPCRYFWALVSLSLEYNMVEITFMKRKSSLRIFWCDMNVNKY